MSWATVWRTLMREEALRTRIKTDPHSPGMYRATQPLKNIDAFYEAFGIYFSTRFATGISRAVRQTIGL